MARPAGLYREENMGVNWLFIPPGGGKVIMHGLVLHIYSSAARGLMRTACSSGVTASHHTAIDIPDSAGDPASLFR
jgi:hypothetical protein